MLFDRLPEPLFSQIQTIVDSPDAIPGWCNAEKGHALAGLIVREQPQVVMELGVYQGRSLVCQALAMKHNAVSGSVCVAVDPWNMNATQEGNLPEAEEWWKSADFEQIHQEFLGHLKKWELEAWVHVIRQSSQDAAKEIADESVDVLHIDGNHSQLASTRDVQLYLPKLKSGGWLWMDDTCWDSVQNAFNVAKTQCDLIHDSGWWSLLRKK